MALCAYHEDIEAVATCVDCKSPICGSCREHGADGLCGMCLEMSQARKAAAEASRQARVEAASQGPRPVPASAGGPPRPPAGPPRPPAGPPRGPAVNGKPPRPAGAPNASRGGFCVEHDGQQLTAMCTHCQKKVCPYCLDLYDHCPECRLLPHCSRHESMVSAAKCESCNLDYCKLCLDGTAFCDRCRTLGMAAVTNAKTGGTGKLDPAKAQAPGPRKGTGELDPAKAAPAGPPRRGTGELDPSKAAPRRGTGELDPGKARGPRPAAPPPKPGQPGYRPGGKGQAAQPAGKMSTNQAIGYAVGGLLLLGGAAWLIFGDMRPRLSPEEANAATRQEMELVQSATLAIKEQTGKWPSSVDAVKKQIEAQGVVLSDLNPPLTLVVNGVAKEPSTVTLDTNPDGFEVRALDADGAPLAENGRDVVLGPPKAKEPPAEEGAATEEAPPPPAEHDHGHGHGDAPAEEAPAKPRNPSY